MTVEEYVAALVASWPPLSVEQLDRIAVLMRDPAAGQDATPAEPLGEAS